MEKETDLPLLKDFWEKPYTLEKMCYNQNLNSDTDKIWHWNHYMIVWLLGMPCKIIITAFFDSKTCHPVYELVDDTCRKKKMKFSFQLLSKASER